VETTALHAEWKPRGRVTLDGESELAFPQVPTGPGAYELRLTHGGEVSAYVGETDNLRRRLSHYRNPGPTQRTNIRMNEEWRRRLASDWDALLFTCDVASIDREADPLSLDLNDKYARQLVESAHILHLRKAGIDLLNA